MSERSVGLDELTPRLEPADLRPTTIENLLLLSLSGGRIPPAASPTSPPNII